MLHTITQNHRLLLRAGAASMRPVLYRTAVRNNSWWSKIIYPFSEEKNTSPSQSYVKTGKNQCFLSIRSDNELNDVLLFNNRLPLILNFTVRGNETCNKLTGALNRIVLLETDKRINICDVETDFLDTRDAMLRFGVTQIPTLVAVRKTFLVDSFTQPELRSEDVNWLQLKAWIEKNADE
ncbi:unnamed protein product [Kluyveromyces dobzhanskii CBS 2104]|uniref:WGS project CCBQ000000000 data, contig 00058 n=1 Tax=Kluyveromyces dobzhanskii CBS 2104 TaxID=1427455 RepID=A0A0A8LBG9_9SACH|nr:unnamed protein product [Kluyveromyces dobzhanskii CBS 2104]